MKTALTPALSHPMGEGESLAAAFVNPRAEIAGRLLEKRRVSDCCSLSPGGEGQGEGERSTNFFLRINTGAIYG